MRSWESLYEAGWRDGQWHDMLKAGLALISPSSYPPFYSDASNIALFVHISKRLGWADPSEAVAKFGLCLAQFYIYIFILGFGCRYCAMGGKYFFHEDLRMLF